MICAECGFESCACHSGRTTISAGGGSLEECRRRAEAYLARRGYTAKLQRARRRRTRIGIIGYQAWDLDYRVWRP
jgi:hypothetical protein